MRCSHYWKLGLHEVCKYSYQAGKCSLSLSQHRNPSLILSRQVEIMRFHFWPLSPPLFEYEMTICQISPSCLSPILGGNEIRVSQNPLLERGATLLALQMKSRRPAPVWHVTSRLMRSVNVSALNCPAEAASGLIVNNDLRSVSETVYKLMFFFFMHGLSSVFFQTSVSSPRPARVLVGWVNIMREQRPGARRCNGTLLHCFQRFRRLHSPKKHVC